MKLLAQRKGWIAVFAILVTVFWIVGCSDGSLEEQTQEVITGGGGDSPEIRVTAMAPTDAAVLGDLQIKVTPGEGGYDVNVSTGNAAIDESQLFLNVSYDPGSTHADGLNVDATTDSDDMIGIAVEPSNGNIDFGVVVVDDTNLEANPASEGEEDDGSDGKPDVPEDGPTPYPGDGDDGGGDEGSGNVDETVGIPAGTALLSFKLVPGAADRTTSAASGKMARARNLDFSQDTEGNWVLAWDYTNPGDNNQDGLVSASDLTPIGQNWLAKVTNDWDDPLRNVDGNHDGEVNVSDITAIGQNYECELAAYKIEMSEDGETDFITVGELMLTDMSIAPGEAMRFTYTFGAQYVEGAWYRVRAMDKDMNLGPASEAISEAGRRMDPLAVAPGQKVTITVFAHDLPNSLAQLNSVRVVFPPSFTYVVDSANVGSIGGARGNPDGIWSTFAEGIIFGDDFFFQQAEVNPDGRHAINFNVTVARANPSGAPVGYGDLINFQLEGTGEEDLTLEFEPICSEGLKRTYYTADDDREYFFGNKIGFKIQ